MTTDSSQPGLAGVDDAEAPSPKNTELVAVQGAVAHFDRVQAGMAALQERYGSAVFECKTKEGMEQAVAARAELREIRVNVEKTRTAAKAPLLKLGKDLDGQAARLKSGLEALENPIDDQIKAEQERKAAEKAAREQAERERIANINAAVQGIRDRVTAAAGKTSAEIAVLAAEVEGMKPDTEFFAEFLDSAKVAIHETARTLRTLQTAAVAAEEKAVQDAADKAELEELRAAQAKRDEEAAAREAAAAEQRRREDEARREQLRQEDEARAARLAEEERQLEERRAAIRREEEALEARQRAAREEEERKAAEIRAAAEAEERARAEAAAAEQRRRDEEAARLRAEQEARERAEAEERRQEEERLAAREKRLRDAAHELLVICRSFEVKQPDADNAVWLHLHPTNCTGKAAINLGSTSQIGAKTALFLEEARKAAVAQALGTANEELLAA